MIHVIDFDDIGTLGFDVDAYPDFIVTRSYGDNESDVYMFEASDVKELKKKMLDFDKQGCCYDSWLKLDNILVHIHYQENHLKAIEGKHKEYCRGFLDALEAIRLYVISKSLGDI